MPVRSLNSSVLKWHTAEVVDQAVRRWAQRIMRQNPNVQRIGYFGSYARGDWGVGSDLDLIIIVDKSDEPFEKRSRDWDVTELPVPADVLVYTRDEWDSMQPNRFKQTLLHETVWI